MKKLRVAVVDDERLARQRLRRLLQDQPDLELVLECSNGADAVRDIARALPDIVFLDIQMAGLDGLNVAKVLQERFGRVRAPLIVFVTAYDEHAVRAFDLEAVDYLVKPFEDERLLATMERVRRRFGIEGDIASAGESSGIMKRLLIRNGARSRVIDATSVDWIEAEGVYARLHIGAASHLIRIPMHDLEARLEPTEFVRIHRSTIVNIDRIAELREVHRGDLEVVLKDGTFHRLSRHRSRHCKSGSPIADPIAEAPVVPLAPHHLD